MPKVDKISELPEAAPPSAPFAPVAANVALKLPVLWLEVAKVWFEQADTHVAIKSISVSKTKFYHAVASLPEDVAAQILDLI